MHPEETSSRELSIDEVHGHSKWQQIEETYDHFALTCLPNSTDVAIQVITCEFFHLNSICKFFHVFFSTLQMQQAELEPIQGE